MTKQTIRRFMTTNGRFMLVKISVPMSMRFVVLQKAMTQWNNNITYIFYTHFPTAHRHGRTSGETRQETTWTQYDTCMANFGGIAVSPTVKWCMCTRMTKPSRGVLLVGKIRCLQDFCATSENQCQCPSYNFPNVRVFAVAHMSQRFQSSLQLLQTWRRSSD